MRVQLDESMSEASNETSGKEQGQTHQEMVVMEKLEKGEENVFNIVRSKKKSMHQSSTLEPAPRKVLHTLPSNSNEERNSPAKKYINHDDEVCPSLQTQGEKNLFDLQGCDKRINDMMMKQEDFGEFASALKPADINKKPTLNFSNSFENGNNFPLKIKTENDDQENKLPNNFTSFLKKEAGTPLGNQKFTFGKDFSPKVQRDNLLLSPLFSSHQHGGFFSNLTPRYFSGFNHHNDHKGFGNDDFAHMDGNENLKFHNHMSMIGDHQKGLNLDIDLIDDSFLHMPLTKSPNMNFLGSQPTSKCTFNRFGDWTLSPNASYLPRKKF